MIFKNLLKVVLTAALMFCFLYADGGSTTRKKLSVVDVNGNWGNKTQNQKEAPLPKPKEPISANTTISGKKIDAKVMVKDPYITPEMLSQFRGSIEQ
ncbi:hypothetical protein ACPF04_06315 [Campylobacter sp. MOP51]|uniref:hypothetical protein n=1 Tax=Campylobacter canis TaxID=3378588 RepID=UPI003C37F0FF